MAPATRADVDALLPDAATILVEFVVTDDSLLVFFARRGDDGVRFSTQFEPASRRTIAERVTRLLQPETLRDQAAWRKATLELMPGLAAAFGTATRAIVVPHEVLWRVPFEALATEDGLARRHDHHRLRAVGDGSGANTTAIGSCEFVTATRRRGSTGAPAGHARGDCEDVADWTIRGGALAEQEATPSRVGRGDRAHVLAGAGGDRGGTSRAPAPADVIHLGAPFRVNGASPLFSPMLLARDPATTERSKRAKS